MDRIYLMPVVSVATPFPAKRGKYHTDYAAQLYAIQMYGAEPWCMVAFADPENAASALDATLKEKPDVLAFPELDATIQVASLAGLRAVLETMFIPGDWADAGVTYRTLARKMLGAFQFMGAFQARYSGRLFEQANLDTKWEFIPESLKTAFITTASEKGYTTENITAQTLLRDAMRYMSEQWGSASFVLSGVTV